MFDEFDGGSDQRAAGGCWHGAPPHLKAVGFFTARLGNIHQVDRTRTNKYHEKICESVARQVPVCGGVRSLRQKDQFL